MENIWKVESFNVRDSNGVAGEIERDLKKVCELLKVRNYSGQTVERYSKWVREFLELYGTNKGQKEINEFLTMLAQKLVPKLKKQVELVRALHKMDVKDGWGRVELPGNIVMKYAGAEKELKWQWLFPQRNR